MSIFLGTMEGGEGACRSCSVPGNISRKYLAGETANLLLGAGLGLLWLPFPSPQPPPTPSLVGEGQEAGGTQLCPVPVEKCWLDGFPRVPRLAGVWLAFHLSPLRLGHCPETSWHIGQGSGFLGSGLWHWCLCPIPRAASLPPGCPGPVF